MKKLYGVLIIILMVNLVGCNGTNRLDKELSEKVKVFELNYWSIINLNITYNEFQKSIEDISSQYIENLNEDFTFTYNDENDEIIEIRVKELKNKDSEKFKKAKEELDEIRKLMYGDNPTITLKISGAYDANVTNKNWNTVYTQKIISMNDDVNTLLVINTRYTFEEIDGGWKIFRIDRDSKGYSDNDKEKYSLTKEEFFKDVMRLEMETIGARHASIAKSTSKY